MLAAALFAVVASLPLGVWPSEIGRAATTVQDVEFYLVDPEDDYSIIAIQPLAVPLRKAEPAELGRLASVATRLGADGVLLLSELPERSIPEDPDAPLPTTGRYAVAVFVSFDEGEGQETRPAVPSAVHRVRGPRRAQLAAPRARLASTPRRLPSDARVLVEAAP